MVQCQLSNIHLCLSCKLITCTSDALKPHSNIDCECMGMRLILAEAEVIYSLNVQMTTISQKTVDKKNYRYIVYIWCLLTCIYKCDRHVQINHIVIMFNDNTTIQKLSFIWIGAFGLPTQYVLMTIHWGRVTHKCVSKLTLIGSDNGLAPGRHQPIIWTNASILLTGPLEQTLMKFQSNFINLQSIKCISKSRLEHGGHLVSPSMC